MTDKNLQEEINKYRSRLQPKIDKVCDEYAHDMQEFVIDLHKDIFNKFSDEDDWDEFMCSVSVIQSLLFDQVCRTMAPVASEKYWKAVLDNMHDCCIERCKVWLKIYQKHHEENKNV